MNKLKSLLILLLFFIVPFISVGQTPPAPPPCPSNSNNKVGGSGPAGAPIEDGVWLMIGLACCYGVYGFSQTRRKTKELSIKNNTR